MPRISHTKSRRGCKRCKERKVKCDEAKPICGACFRHGVTCEYLSVHDEASGSIWRPQADHLLELRLMHEWMAEVCETLTPAWEFWKFEAPQLAFSCQYLLDAVLAVSALRMSRKQSRRWPLNVTTDEAIWESIPHDIAPPDDESRSSMTPDLSEPTPMDMLMTSRKYFARALKGQQEVVTHLDAENTRTAFTSSLLIYYYSFLALSEDSNTSVDSQPVSLEPLEQWIGIGVGIVSIINHWRTFVGKAWMAKAGSVYGEPNLANDEDVFRPEFRLAFDYLLSPVNGQEIKPDDRESYEQTLSYIGLMYKGITEGFDSDLAIARRMFAMPARVPRRFIELVGQQDSRAIAFLAHYFAIVKVAESKLPWLCGIGDRQVPILCASVGPGWLHVVQWPLTVVNTCTDQGVA